MVAGDKVFGHNSETQPISLSLGVLEGFNCSIGMCVPLCLLQTAGQSGPSGPTATRPASSSAFVSASFSFPWAASARATPRRAEPVLWIPTLYQVRSAHSSKE